MQQRLKALSDLQKVDAEIAALRKAGEVFPKQIAELEKELSSTRASVESERTKLSDIERQRRELELTTTQEKDKVKKWETRLAEQRSTREYAALAREIDIARKANLTMGEELVELGKSQNTQRELLGAKESELSGRQSDIASRISALREKFGESEKQIQALEAGRAEVAAKVDGSLLRNYDNIRKKRMPAMVPVNTNGTCAGCNRNLPPQQYLTLRTTLNTDTCPACHRIIYAPEALETPKGS